VASRDAERARAFATSAADAARCFDAAEAAGRRCIEGMMWRHHPQTALAGVLEALHRLGRARHPGRAGPLISGGDRGPDRR
jgi:hypothetical protein